MNSRPWLLVAVYVRAPAALLPIATESAPNSLSTLMNSHGLKSPLFTSSPKPSTMCVCGEIAAQFRRERLITVPATAIALEHLGRPLPNAVLLGGVAALTGLISLDSVSHAIRAKFSGRVAEGNVAAAIEAHAFVKRQLEELADAQAD